MFNYIKSSLLFSTQIKNDVVQKDVELDKLDHDIHSLRVKSSRLSTLIQKKTEALHTVPGKPGIGVTANTVGYELKREGRAGVTTGASTGIITGGGGAGGVGTGVGGGVTGGVRRGSKPLSAAASTTALTSLQRNSSRSNVTSTTGSDLGPSSKIDSTSHKEKERIKRREKDFNFK